MRMCFITKLSAMLLTFLVPAVQAHAAGAFAAADCGLGSGVVDAPNLDEARRIALQTCRAHDFHHNCRVVATVRGGCIVAVRDEANICFNNTFAVGQSFTISANQALEECQSKGGTKCRIATGICDRRN